MVKSPFGIIILQYIARHVDYYCVCVYILLVNSVNCDAEYIHIHKLKLPFEQITFCE